MRIKKWSKWPKIKCVNFFNQIFTTNSLKNCVEISVENMDIGALLKKKAKAWNIRIYGEKF